jgi:hypothetical protein
MKGISINGVEYLPASALAKQFRYTTDYIGQLCRAKKVDSQLVGRSWYVNPSSLTNHKNARYAKSSLGQVEKSAENISEEATKINISRLEVEPVVAKNTVKMSHPSAVVVADSNPVHANFAKRIDWKPLKYEADAGDLLPKFNREVEPRKIAINLVDSTSVSIKTITKTTKMEAEELPVVSLHGKLNVSSLNETFETPKEEEFKGEVPLPPLPTPVKVSSRPLARPIHLSLPTKMSIERVDKAKKPITIATPTKAEVLVETPISSSLFIPKSVLKNQTEEENGIEFVEVALLTTSGVLVMSLLVLIFGESTVAADASSYTWGIDFSTHSLSALVSLFSN